MIPVIDVTATADLPPIADETAADVMGKLLFKIVTDACDAVDPYRKLYK
jgi:hypothetical protein